MQQKQCTQQPNIHYAVDENGEIICQSNPQDAKIMLDRLSKLPEETRQTYMQQLGIDMDIKIDSIKPIEGAGTVCAEKPNAQYQCENNPNAVLGLTADGQLCCLPQRQSEAEMIDRLKYVDANLQTIFREKLGLSPNMYYDDIIAYKTSQINDLVARHRVTIGVLEKQHQVRKELLQNELTRLIKLRAENNKTATVPPATTGVAAPTTAIIPTATTAGIPATTVTGIPNTTAGGDANILKAPSTPAGNKLDQMEKKEEEKNDPTVDKNFLSEDESYVLTRDVIEAMSKVERDELKNEIEGLITMGVAKPQHKRELKLIKKINKKERKNNKLLQKKTDKSTDDSTALKKLETLLRGKSAPKSDKEKESKMDTDEDEDEENEEIDDLDGELEKLGL